MTPDEEFEAFFVAHFDRLVRSLTAMTGDTASATDAVQEAFIKAYSRWSRLRRYDDPASWVRRVAINKNRDTRRSFSRRRAREDRFEQPALVDSEVTWESDYEVDVVDVLERLSPRQRSVAVLFYLEDLSTSEIASSLGISVGAVKFHLNKARTALRAILEEEGGPNERLW
jgi:RNA polymerase sigma-70 factor (ECF subfamily)